MQIHGLCERMNDKWYNKLAKLSKINNKITWINIYMQYATK